MSFKTLGLVCAGLLMGGSAFAAGNSEFDKGACYLFTARLNAWSTGEVVKVTPQAVVFKNIARVFVQEGEGWMDKQDGVLKAFIDGSNRSVIATAPAREVSYSRAAMTAIKLNNCNRGK